jgi:hypothetical protein
MGYKTTVNFVDFLGFNLLRKNCISKIFYHCVSRKIPFQPVSKMSQKA